MVCGLLFAGRKVGKVLRSCGRWNMARGEGDFT